MDDHELARRFTAYPVGEAQALTMQRIRIEAQRLAETIIDEAPEGREQSLAITALEEVVFWTNAAIARPKP